MYGNLGTGRYGLLGFNPGSALDSIIECRRSSRAKFTGASFHGLWLLRADVWSLCRRVVIFPTARFTLCTHPFDLQAARGARIRAGHWLKQCWITSKLSRHEVVFHGLSTEKKNPSPSSGLKLQNQHTGRQATSLRVMFQQESTPAVSSLGKPSTSLSSSRPGQDCRSSLRKHSPFWMYVADESPYCGSSASAPDIPKLSHACTFYSTLTASCASELNRKLLVETYRASHEFVITIGPGVTRKSNLGSFV